MRTTSLLPALLLTAWVAFGQSGSLAADPAPPPIPNGHRVDSAADGKMESLRRNDGKEFFGLIQSASNDEIEFVEVVRPRGNPIYLVVHYYPPRSVQELTRLPEEQRAELIRRIQPLLTTKSRARIEAGRMEDVVLAEETRDGVHQWLYQGQWFMLRSTSDEETTRRCVVRSEQIFRAYRQVLPPRTEPRETLQVVLYGSIDEYRGYLQARGLEITNPAFYSAPQNMIVAGSDLSRYAQWLEQIRAQNVQIRKHYNTLNAELPQRLAGLSSQLKQRGFTPDEIRFEMNARKATWEKEYAAMLGKVNEVDRRNAAKFADVTQQMFSRLYHEAFHAYLENYVFPHRQYDVPRWLNEGLAQIFENGQLDDDTLRIDAPSRDALRQLQSDLSSGDPLPLAKLLTSQEKEFLVTHAAGSSQRHYLYSWGLAYYLTFQQDLLGGDSLNGYVSTDAASLSPVTRFERLAGAPLPEFERRWRTAIVSLKPPPQ
jgi:demethoxyubiquinone hydroxylase (CLK1/Coq7/Cat5 family)